MFMAIFKRLFKKKPKVQTGIPREKFIQLINLGYDKFKSKEEIQEFVQEGKKITHFLHDHVESIFYNETYT